MVTKPTEEKQIGAPLPTLTDSTASTDKLELRITTASEGPDNAAGPASAPEAGLVATNAGTGVANQAAPIEAASAAPEGLTLSDGSIAVVRGLKGSHLMKAQAQAGSDSSKLTFVLVAMATRINGKPIVMEDLQEMPLRDVMEIMGAYNEKNA